MKKVVVTLLMVVVAQLAMAQDIIFKKYEDAKECKQYTCRRLCSRWLQAR